MSRRLQRYIVRLMLVGFELFHYFPPIDILQQLRKIPPAAAECRRAIVESVPLIREVEILLQVKNNENLTTPEQFLQLVPSIKYVLGQEHPLIRGFLKRKERQVHAKNLLVPNSSFRSSIEAWDCDPVMANDLCTIRLNALIDFATKWDRQIRHEYSR